MKVLFFYCYLQLCYVICDCNGLFTNIGGNVCTSCGGEVVAQNKGPDATLQNNILVLLWRDYQ